MLLLAGGFTTLAVRGVLELALGLRAGMPDLPAWAEAAAILFNLLGLIALGAASLIAMAAEEEAIVRRQSDERHRAERVLQQGQRLESLGRLAGGVAHDFNNVLAVVMATAENLREDALTTGQLTEIDEISAAADSGRSLVRQLLTFARQQPARTETFVADVQLGELRTILTRLTKGVELRIALDADSARVHMDRSQFDQVMLNLVVNVRDACDACDACDAGGHIAVSSTVRYETPMGVLAARMAATRTTDAAPYEAWICIGVEDTGGDVVVESTPGGGTRFESWLPLASASAALMAAAATPIS
ncbi:sensor histidine kinase [Gemmatimonas sp.]|uniref:sensor histidine kinase n=1 Tax=Gemmatimonas sp. TaxID=1962908 RepID=UPI003DA5818E